MPERAAGWPERPLPKKLAVRRGLAAQARSRNLVDGVELPRVSRHNPLEVMAARAVIGRDEELAAVRAFLGRIEDGPCALVLSGESGIREDSSLGNRRRRGRTEWRPRARRPRHRGGGPALLRRALGSARARLRRRRLVAATAAPAGAGGRLAPRRARRGSPGRARHRPRGARCAGRSCRARPGSRRARRSPVARSSLRRSDPDRTPAASRGAGRAPGDAQNGG